MDYPRIARLIEFAAAEGATGVTVDTDSGLLVFTVAEIREEWEHLAPGEPLEIVSIHWK